MTTATDTLSEVTLTVVRGDAEDYLITAQNDADPAVPYDLSAARDGTPSRPAVIRFTVRKQVSDPLPKIAKRSYDSSQIALAPQVGATIGQFTVFVDHPDTVLAPGTYVWDLEITRQSAVRSGASAGSLSAAAGATIITGSGTAFTKAVVGDVVQILSGPESGKVALITKINSDISFEIEQGAFGLLSSASFEIRRGFRKTPLRGPFIVLAEVSS